MYSRSYSITNRTESITSNTKCFKFSTRHSIILIFSLVNKVIRSSILTSNLSRSSSINSITSFNQIIEVRTRKIFFKTIFMRKNSFHAIKHFVLTSTLTILLYSRKFTKLFKRHKTNIFSSFFINFQILIFKRIHNLFNSITFFFKKITSCIINTINYFKRNISKIFKT